MASLHLPRSRRSLLALGTAAALVGGAAAYRTVTAQSAPTITVPTLSPTSPSRSTEDRLGFGWGPLEEPAQRSPLADARRCHASPPGTVGSLGPTVVLPHCWAGSHAMWVPVARRLVESGHRVVHYDQRGHGASSRGTAPLDH